MRLHNQLQRRFIRTGGTWLAGDEVTRIGHQEGNVSEVWTRQHGDVPLRPPFCSSASGSFFSNGLIADKERVREPILGLDLQQTTPRENWYQRDFFASQPWQRFGLKTDTMLRPLLDGQPLGNLFAIGSLLGGLTPSSWDAAAAFARSPRSTSRNRFMTLPEARDERYPL
ncbi:Anaerobic glycerol-3-phosphate dehydrogenase subunit B [Raoultella planticola]|uniref:Anaerobic glycerol-3-phosphate dehydrogenase subunit B n=1 Tax=Raoultella planticola TaxID=575 RepID=A0A485C5S7_RAOPL|nr:Anaerobic glycerol-3-phosphate dehydrogenase subunit B [Raoultella planticola]